MPAPILALNALRPIEVQARHAGAREAQVGELLRLRVTRAPQGMLMGSDESGLQLQLPPDAALPGEVLLLRVLARQPRLELQVLQRESAAPAPLPGGEGEWTSAAMRPDQAWLQRWHISRSAELPSNLAAQWRARALAQQLRQPEALPGQVLGPEAMLAAHAAPIQLPGWMGQALWLRLLSPLPELWHPLDAEESTADDADSSRGEDGEGHSGLRLCLNLRLDGAWLLVLLQWRHGLLLHFSAQRQDTLQGLRERLPRIAAALAAVPLQLRHCSLSLRQPALLDASASQRAQGLAQAGSQVLFRAAAELVSVLQQG